MQSLLVNLTSMAVLIHMMLGCNWHHGLGVQTCVDQCSASACNHDEVELGDCHEGIHQHGDHDHDHPGNNQNSNDNLSENGNGHGHFGCQDDGCNATTLIKFVFWPAKLSSQCLCVAENSALVAIQARSGQDKDPFPDCSHTETPVRTHLLLGVQLL